MLYEVNKAPIIIDLFMIVSGLVGAVAFAFLAAGLKLILK